MSDNFNNGTFLVKLNGTSDYVPLRYRPTEFVSPVIFPLWHIRKAISDVPKRKCALLLTAIATSYTECNCVNSLNIYTGGSKIPGGHTRADCVA